MKAEENAYAFILTTIFFNRWCIVSHIKSQVSALKFSNENKSGGSHVTSHKPNHLYRTNYIQEKT